MFGITEITQRVEFDYGHRLLSHPGKCKNYHGHRGVLLVTFRGAVDQKTGMVIDFGIVKADIKQWIDEHWDHAMLLEHGDPAFAAMAGTKVFTLAKAPTAENLVEYLATNVIPNLKHTWALDLVEVTLYETPNCSATYRRVRDCG